MKKMKFLKKTAAIALAGIMALSVAACGGEKTNKNQKVEHNGGKEVKIAYWHAGMGVEYLENMVNEFNSRQSDWFVTFEYSAIKDSLMSAFGLEDTDETDLYIVGRSYDTKYMEPLDDLLQSTADGDEKPLIEKFNPSYLEMEIASDGHYYTLTNGGGVIGIVYNKELFEKAGIDVLPRTTDELAVACDMLLEADVTPIANFGTGGYWDFFIDAWQSQYDSFDYYINNFHGCTDLKGNSPSKEVFTTKDGRYQVLKALEKIVTPEYVVAGASSETHTSMQTKFLNSDIGMMVNGSWLSNESGESGDMNNYGVMRTPVISTITDKLTSVRGDKELRAVVSAMDTVIDGEKTTADYQSGDGYEVDGRNVKAADWDYVMAARTTTAVNYVGQSNFIPVYSDAKEGAKEFLKFFYSDAGMKIYADATHVNLPLSLSNGEKIDTSDWNAYELAMDQLLDKTEYHVSYYMMNRHPIFRSGGAFRYFGSIIAILSSRNPEDRKDADGIWEEMMYYVDQRYERDWLANIQ